MTIGSCIANLRAERGWSQRKLADISKLSNTEISRIESGQRNPTPATLRILAEHLDIEYSDLMKAAGYLEEINERDKFYELVFKDGEGKVVDVKRGVKEMFRCDEEWVNIAYRVSRELEDRDRKILKDTALSFLKNRE